MVLSTLAIGGLAKQRVKGLSITLMETFLTEILKQIKLMVTEYTSTRMGRNTMDSGQMMFNRELELKLLLMEVFTKENFTEARSMAKAFTSG
jgi:hypothetical protein